MNLRAIIAIASKAIATNKVRAILTTLGIVIGISAVIALLSLGQGAQSFILNQVQGLGSNTITILPGSGFFGGAASFGAGAAQSKISSLVNNKIDHRIIPLLENKVAFNEITALTPEISSTYTVTADSHSISATILGIESTYFDISGFTADKGRLLNTDDNSKQRRVAVLGATAATKLFGESTVVDESIKINGGNYKVVGVAASKGNSTDNNVFIPLNTASNELTGQKDYSQVIIQVADDSLVDETTVKIDAKLHEFYKIPDGKDATNYTLLTSKDVLSIAQSVTSIFTALLSSIAGISLVVGGIGIMNIMLVSVSERTKEIGLRKAVGAKQKAILSQFLIESVMLTLIGGIIGIIIGLLLAELIGKVASIPVILSPEAIVLATSVSATIGIVFGYYPAYRAAKLSPIDALRYE